MSENILIRIKFVGKSDLFVSRELLLTESAVPGSFHKFSLDWSTTLGFAMLICISLVDLLISEIWRRSNHQKSAPLGELRIYSI